MLRKLLLGALAALLVAPSAALGAVQLGAPKAKPDLDTRTGVVAPTAAQKAAVTDLGAHATWNRYGTVASLLKPDGGWLAQGLSSDPVQAARSFLADHAALFKLDGASVSGLALVADNTLAGSDAHAVLFAQRFGDLASTQDGLIAVGVRDGKVAYVSSSSVGAQAAPGAATLSATEAWLKAAANVGLAHGAVGAVTSSGGWSIFAVAGLAQQQRAKLVAFPSAKGVRPAFETAVYDSHDGRATAYIVYVDAQSGAILFRQNAVYNDGQPTVQTFSGSYTTGCDAPKTFAVDGGMGAIDVVATAAIPTNDIVLKLIDPSGTVVGSSDTATSPEAVHYSPSGGVARGTWSVQVCPFNAPTVPPLQPQLYAGTFTALPISVPALPGLPVPNALPSVFKPTWKFFKANPSLDYGSTDTRIAGCWESAAGCDLLVASAASPRPWDVDPNTGASSQTTRGNNAKSASAWASPLTPGEQYSPVSATRTYAFPWTNQWHKSNCSPASFASPQRADIDAAVTNLFVFHNRMHDWAYRLGFTESAWNLQMSNFGKTSAEGERDPELGDAQAGAVDGGYPSYEGRDNANQIALQDGVPGITNMYLWGPIAGSFYPPCADGDYDMSIVGHEYTHAISNRMVGVPDANLTGLQAGAMGESWSDLDALEFLHEYGLVPTGGEDPWSVGAYATGNKQRGIRDYTVDKNPLNYNDVGFDLTGPEVHADGEIWNGINYAVRQALVDSVGSADAATNLACANGQKPVVQCPGNRRWLQIVFDGFLLMQPGVSMVDARDAYIAADRLVFDGADVPALWKAFAQRGLGVGAASDTAEDTDPTPSFQDPVGPNATVTFDVVPGTKVYVGDYEARATAVPLTTKLAPGSYRFVARAPGYGLARFAATVAGGEAKTIHVDQPVNLASAKQGATATGDGVNLGNLIDDTEATDWASLGAEVEGRQVTVALGGRHVISSVRVSALLHPADANDADDSGSQSRFSALRSFEVWTSTDGKSFTKLYTSPADAFPGAGPRPVAPDLTLRTFDVPNANAAYVRIVVRTNQCTGAPAYQVDDADPTTAEACAANSPQAKNVRIAELEVLGPGGGKTEGRSSAAPGSAAAGGESAPAASKPKPGSGAVAGAAKTVVHVVRGSGTFRTKGRPVGFRVGAQVVTLTGAKLRFRSVEVSSTTVRGSSATLRGTGLRNGKPTTFRIVVTRAKRSTVTAVLGGSRLSGAVVKGSLTIR